MHKCINTIRVETKLSTFHFTRSPSPSITTSTRRSRVVIRVSIIILETRNDPFYLNMHQTIHLSCHQVPREINYHFIPTSASTYQTNPFQIKSMNTDTTNYSASTLYTIDLYGTLKQETISLYFSLILSSRHLSSCHELSILLINTIPSTILTHNSLKEM